MLVTCKKREKSSKEYVIILLYFSCKLENALQNFYNFFEDCRCFSSLVEDVHSCQQESWYVSDLLFKFSSSLDRGETTKQLSTDQSQTANGQLKITLNVSVSFIGAVE